MVKARGERRHYDSPLRAGQALATRGAVLDAARDLFLERGYVATTIDAIAEHAAVSPETVYATFKNKRSILSRLVDISMAGDDDPIPILERSWVDELRREPDPSRRLRLLARNGRLILERTVPIYEVLRGAATADPEIAALWERNKAQRLTGQRALLRIAIGEVPLRDGLDVRTATDTLFAIGSPETYRSLVVDRRWSADRFERWYADALARLLLPADT